MWSGAGPWQHPKDRNEWSCCSSRSCSVLFILQTDAMSWGLVGGAGGGNLSQKVPGVEPLSAVQQQETVRGGESVFFWRVGVKPSDTALQGVCAHLQVRGAAGWLRTACHMISTGVLR